MGCTVSDVVTLIKSLADIKCSKKRIKLPDGSSKGPDYFKTLQAFSCLGLSSEDLKKISALVGDRQFEPGISEFLVSVASGLLERPKAVLTGKRFPGVNVLLEDLQIIRDCETGAVLLQSKDQTLARAMNFELFQSAANQLFGGDKEAAHAWISDRQHLAYPKYTPRRESIYLDDNDERVYNSWTCPAYMRPWISNGYKPEKFGRVPKEFITVMNHLFADEPSRSYAYRWLRDATFSRAGNILVLAGSAGVGKNTYVATGTALVGDDNYTETARLDSEFIAAAVNSTLMFTDEYMYTPKSKELFKKFHNEKSSVEIKFKNTTRPYPMHASIVIATNYIDKCGVSIIDRKFTVPNLNTVKLGDALGDGFYDMYRNELLKDEEYIRDIASYLYFNYPANTSREILKTETFYEACHRFLPHWLKVLIHIAKYKEVVRPADLKKANRALNIPADMAKQEVESYNSNFNRDIGHVEIDENFSWHFVSKLCASENSSTREDVRVE